MVSGLARARAEVRLSALSREHRRVDALGRSGKSPDAQSGAARERSVPPAAGADPFDRSVWQTNSEGKLKMKSWILALVPILAGLAPVARAAEEGSPIKVESGISQLFVDDYLIATQDGLKRTLHQPKKDGGGNTPLLALDKEFDPGKDTLEANGTIVY